MKIHSSVLFFFETEYCFERTKSSVHCIWSSHYCCSSLCLEEDLYQFLKVIEACFKAWKTLSPVNLFYFSVFTKRAYSPHLEFSKFQHGIRASLGSLHLIRTLKEGRRSLLKISPVVWSSARQGIYKIDFFVCLKITVQRTVKKNYVRDRVYLSAVRRFI